MTSPISPLRSMLKLGRVILPMSCMLSCIAQFLHHIWIAICLLAYYINHIFELYHASCLHTQHLSELWHGNPFNKDIIQLYHLILFSVYSHHILNYGILSVNVCELWHANLFNKHIIQLCHVILFTQSHILNYVFPSFLVSHHNVKLCHAILFSQPSYM